MKKGREKERRGRRKRERGREGGRGGKKRRKGSLKICWLFTFPSSLV